MEVADRRLASNKGETAKCDETEAGMMNESVVSEMK